MSKSLKKILPTILFGASVVLFFVGMFLVAYTLSNTYQLVGDCELGSQGCSTITWQGNLIRVGAALLLIGPVLALIGIILYERNKKHLPPEASDNQSKPKKQ
jgi:hypothetical protein